MKRFLPGRLSLTNQIKESKTATFSSIHLDEDIDHLDEDIELFLNTINFFNPEIKDRLFKKGIRTLNDFAACDLVSLLEIFAKKENHLFIENLKGIKAEIQKKVIIKTKTIGISVIVPYRKLIPLIDKINKAINLVAGFTTGIIPQKNNIISFESGPGKRDGLEFWIQDKLLCLKKTKLEENGKKIHPIDDSLGRIEQIAFSYYSNNDENLENSYNKIYTDLIFKIARVFDKMTLLNPGLNERDEKLIFLEPKDSKNSHNHPEILKTMRNGQKIDVDIHHIDLALIGGNILFVGGFALVGYDSILYSTFDGIQPEKELTDFVGMNKDKCKREQFFKKFKIYEDLFKKRFFEKTGIKKDDIIFIGSKEDLAEAIDLPQNYFKVESSYESYAWIKEGDGRFSAQGIYHIDLFITAAGKDEVSGNNRVLIGEPILEGENHIPVFNHVKKLIAKIADRLVEQKEFSIFRNPLPLTFIDDYFLDEEKLATSRTWFFASYNNALVQYTKSPEHRYVWMPVYGSDYSNEFLHVKNNHLIKKRIEDSDEKCDVIIQPCGDWSYLKKYDNENKRIWRSLGFKVEKLTNYLPFAKERGAVRCMTKILYRSPYE